MESVIPRLVRSLHKRKGHPVISISELLLSFVAAYKDIPPQRRQELFLSLANKIGADEFLFALILLLIDKYPSRKSVLEFAAGLVERQKITTQLIVNLPTTSVRLPC
jgi:U3 small nucleolar RNA-associated protein 10